MTRCRFWYQSLMTSIQTLALSSNPFSGRWETRCHCFQLILATLLFMKHDSQCLTCLSKVWLSLFLSTVIVAYIFKKVQCLVLRHVNKSPKQPNERRNGMKLTNPYLYIFGNILSQGYDINIQMTTASTSCCIFWLCTALQVELSHKIDSRSV